MSDFIFYIMIIPWGSVFLGLLIGSTILELEMKRHRIPENEFTWDINRDAFLTDPADLTEIGKIHRQKALVVELLLFFWVAVGIVGYLVVSSFSN
jgi:hypothetical protein